MTREGVGTFTTRDIPKFDGAIFAATGEGLAIGTPHHRPNRIGMSVQGVQEITRARIPEFDGAIFATTGEGLAIGTPRHRPHPTRMSGTG